MDFPQTAQVKKLNLEHPDFQKYKEAWTHIGILYEGGTAMRSAVQRGLFLTKNTKELPEVYGTRQQRVSYTNLLGNVMGWYISALFKQQPQMEKRLAEVEGPDAMNIPQDVQDFCNEFESDCTHSGQSLNAFIHDVAECALLYRTAWVAIDLPVPVDDDVPETLQQQQELGLLDPYLVLYTPDKVTNWETDSYGNLEWAQIYIRVNEQEFLEDPTVTDYWYYFDRENVALYERAVKAGNTGSTGAEDEVATLAAGYPRHHAMADQQMVPIHRVTLPQGLWLANRVFLPLLNHLNLDNALDFGLYQSNLPQLTITDGPNGTYEEPVTVSAVGYHHLPFGAAMNFLEPTGKSFSTSQERIGLLEERIYKACYLMDQARSNKSTPTAQSGVSKQQDKTPSRDALSGIGDVLRPAMQELYQCVLCIAGFGDVIKAHANGFDFSDKATAEDMNLLEQATIIPVNSPTFEREVGKKNVRLALPDLAKETRDIIDDEIDTLPTPAEQQAQVQEQQRQDAISKFTASMKTGSAGNPAIQ